MFFPPRSEMNWEFPKIGVPQNGWFIMENPIKMDDLGIPLFLETPNYQYATRFAMDFLAIYFWLLPQGTPPKT